MKRSDMVILAVLGSTYGYSIFHHDSVYRDQYASKEACVRDWGDSASCEQDRTASGGGSGTGRYYGPSYEDGGRPTTNAPGATEGRTVINRGGFGRSGARFSRGG